MKKSTFLVIAISATLALQGCGQRETDSTETADSINEAKADTAAVAKVEDDDAEFMVKAADGGLIEVELGTLAQKRSWDPDVKRFGKAMVEDHSAVNRDLMALAAKKEVTLPSTPGKDNLYVKEELAKLEGMNFDKAYTTRMLKDHQKDISLFEEAERETRDPEVKAFIAKTLPKLRAHLSHLGTMQKKKAVRDRY